MMATDEELIERYLAGETEAFNRLVGKWEKRIFNFVLRYCGSREDAQDISQEIFTSVFQRLSSLKNRERFSPWLYTIALNCCRMRYRGAKGRRIMAIDAPESSHLLAKEATLSFSRGGGNNPEERVGHMETRRLLMQTLADISEEQRLVILLKEYEGLRFHEIAEILECPLSTIKSRLYHGLRAMRERLEQQGLSIRG